MTTGASFDTSRQHGMSVVPPESICASAGHGLPPGKGGWRARGAHRRQCNVPRPISPDTALYFDEDGGQLTLPPTQRSTSFTPTNSVRPSRPLAIFCSASRKFTIVMILGMVYDTRANNQQAALYYCKVGDFIREHPERYDHEFASVSRGLVDKFDPPPLPSYLQPP
jgi:hypothetical protein